MSQGSLYDIQEIGENNTVKNKGNNEEFPTVVHL